LAAVAATLTGELNRRRPRSPVSRRQEEDFDRVAGDFISLPPCRFLTATDDHPPPILGLGGALNMRYLCLVYCEPNVFDRMTGEEQKTLDRDSLAYDEELRVSGHMVHAHALQSVDKAVTLRVRNAKMSSTDGPFAETKEHLGGFILIEAADMEEAKRVAAGIPMARLGSIEVRPIYDIPIWE
jgi:hypothetical protein